LNCLLFALGGCFSHLAQKLRERAGHAVHKVTLDDFMDFGAEHPELLEMFRVRLIAGVVCLSC
jgi:hypothetical protein